MNHVLLMRLLKLPKLVFSRTDIKLSFDIKKVVILPVMSFIFSAQPDDEADFKGIYNFRV